MNTSWVCLDASLLIPLVMDKSGERLEAQFAKWVDSERRLAAPALIKYEVCNALYQYEKVGVLDGDLVDRALQSVLEMPIKLFADQGLHNKALQIARRFSLPAAFDAHYLALADWLGAEFWTLDKRLAQAVGEGFPWISVWQGGEL